MTCRKVRKVLPLMAGGDLAGRKAVKVEAHLAVCASCRRELEEYWGALGRVRAAARAEGAGEWSEAEWLALMARVAGGRPGRNVLSPLPSPSATNRPYHYFLQPDRKKLLRPIRNPKEIVPYSKLYHSDGGNKTK